MGYFVHLKGYSTEIDSIKLVKRDKSGFKLTDIGPSP